MKTIKLFSILLLLVTLIIDFGCKGDVGDSGPTGPSGPGGPKLMGKISGNIILIDTNGIQPSVKNGVTVTIEGLGKSTQTDSSGKWVIDSVYSGIYTIDYSKNLYGMGKYVNYQFIGGGATFLGNAYLSMAPNFTVSNLTFTAGVSGGNTYVDIKGSISFNSPQTIGRNILLFIGNSNSVSSDPGTYLDVVSAFALDTSLTFSQRITESEFSHIGIQTGSTAYIAAYTSSAQATNNSRYLDVNTGRYFYTSLSTNNPAVLSIFTPMDRR